MADLDAVFDVIVVGAGSAGAVLAARLSEDRDVRVLLLEAGDDHPESPPAELADASFPVLSGHNWDLTCVRREQRESAASSTVRRAARALEIASRGLAPPAAGGAVLAAGLPARSMTMPYPMGRTVGGSSSVNGALALLPRAADFAAWVRLGNTDWSWDRTEPYCRRVVNGDHGKSAMPLFAASPPYTDLQRAFADSCERLGFGWSPDPGAGASGLSAIPKNARGGRRLSAAEVYLRGARSRRNLTLVARCHVDRVCLHRTDGPLRADGVDALHEGAVRRFRGRRIVLCAGAIHSPCILQRSGIGDSAALAHVGIEPRHHLPSVGRHLVDHASVTLWGIPHDRDLRPTTEAHQLMLEHRVDRSERPDLQLFALGPIPSERFPTLRTFVQADVAMGISVVLATPMSRGSVGIAARDPLQAPNIRLGCLDHPDDLRRMTVGVSLAASLLRASPLRSRLRDILLWTSELVDDEARLTEAIHRFVGGAWHPVGSARMGPADDADAVVDAYGEVRGCERLTVADASIMPEIPGVPTHLTCLVIAERIADRLRGLRD